MRINVFVAQATGLSRRAADRAISDGKVTVNGAIAGLGDQVEASDLVILDNQILELASVHQTIILNKPVGYVCSRDGQGSLTVYELLPAELHALKPVGRLDKDSSGLLLMTTDGNLANRLAHPSYQKQKVYEISLDKMLSAADKSAIEHGIQLKDGPSALKLASLSDDGQHWQATMQEGRNRQIRRTFDQQGYTVTALHRTDFGDYHLDQIKTGSYVSSVT